MKADVKVIGAEFLTSASSIDDAPPCDRGEIVFLGRSNVGKSSLLNALMNRKNLAKTSSTPGKTRLINFFNLYLEYMGEKCLLRLIDMPGFGYAKVSKEKQNEWQRDLVDFLKNRISIRTFIRLIDSRHTALKQDDTLREFITAIIRADQSEICVLTKIDKLNKKERDMLKRSYSNAFMVSNSTKEGIDELLTYMLKAGLGTDQTNAK
ncbi:MAG: ribosome biogenesis GTP-binding protein YihA/YsxC [Helicobacteraceae bacterium]|jgi:GTP-binding protein|nr:ribosome biogenesis GTP-binding protein YihA/YsxC [Helicobacteraceae bacterium]